jgi:hypothetical protein
MQHAYRMHSLTFKQDTNANTDDSGAPLPEASTEAVAVTAGERQALLQISTVLQSHQCKLASLNYCSSR